MKLSKKISIAVIIVSCYLVLFAAPQRAFAQNDSVPRQGRGWFRKIDAYVDSLKNRHFRDSVLSKISRHNEPPPSPDDSSMIRSEQGFLPYTGKVIRHVYYRKIQVFGPRNINDTTFTTSMKLIHFANRLHFDSEEWVIRQSLFFREQDTVNAYELADNERYLRNRPFIQDARIRVLETPYSDTVDIQVVTKDIFEYGADLSALSPSVAALRVSNNNLFGAGQGLMAGFRWNNSWRRQWGTEARYTKYNLMGTFMDVSLGYTTLNNQEPMDTGVYEGSYYIKIDRPLYRNSAKFAGGLTVAKNFSINVLKPPEDSLYRDYAYKMLDVWGGYSFRNRFTRNGHFDDRPNLALLFRYYNLHFDKKPEQEIYIKDPIYNDRHYYLGQFLVFKQDFFKAHRFFGFGRTEDIPYGYSAGLSAGWENWTGRKRFYTGLEAQKYWHTKVNGLLSVGVGVSSFWQRNISEDAVIHVNMSYYSKLMRLRSWHWRQFTSLDYLGNPNNYFYKPLNINYERGIWGYRDTRINGYHRLNLRSETVFYSDWKVYGFKFNWFASIQASQLSHKENFLLKNPVYSGFGVGLRVRNENLSLNTLKLAAYYYPNPPPGMRKLFLEVTTVVDFRFDIFAMKAPSFLRFY